MYWTGPGCVWLDWTRLGCPVYGLWSGPLLYRYTYHHASSLVIYAHDNPERWLQAAGHQEAFTDVISRPGAVLIVTFCGGQVCDDSTDDTSDVIRV